MSLVKNKLTRLVTACFIALVSISGLTACSNAANEAKEQLAGSWYYVDEEGTLNIFTLEPSEGNAGNQVTGGGVSSSGSDMKWTYDLEKKTLRIPHEFDGVLELQKDGSFLQVETNRVGKLRWAGHIFKSEDVAMADYTAEFEEAKKLFVAAAEQQKEEFRKEAVGTWKLVSDSDANPIYRKYDDSSITINNDGTYELFVKCTQKDPSPEFASCNGFTSNKVSGKWEIGVTLSGGVLEGYFKGEPLEDLFDKAPKSWYVPKDERVVDATLANFFKAGYFDIRVDVDNEALFGEYLYSDLYNSNSFNGYFDYGRFAKWVVVEDGENIKYEIITSGDEKTYSWQKVN